MSAEAMLVVGHGSRDAEGNQEFLRFVERMRFAFPEIAVEACFIELAEPSIPQGVDRCVALGARRVVVLPVILFAASHVKVEIPLEIDQARRRHPAVDFRYGRHLGIHHRIFEILDERLAEAETALPPGPRAETAVLVIGRGSSDPDANGDLYKVSRLLWEGRGYGGIETCFMGITHPDLPEGIRRCVALGARRILALPYFLFTGVLIRQMRDRLREFQLRYPEIPMRFAGYLGDHPSLVEILAERRAEAVNGTALMNCEMCKYRVLLPGQEAGQNAGAKGGEKVELNALASSRR